MNGDCYLNFLQENIWTTFRLCATRQVYGGCRTVLLPIAPLPPKNSCWTSLEAESSAVEHSCVESAFSRFESFEFLLLDLSSKRSYSAKPTTVEKLINVAKRFSEEHRENVFQGQGIFQCVLHLIFGRISVCSKMEATSSTLYKMYFLLLIIKNPLFLNIFVYYFSFFVIITISKHQ